MLQLFLKKAVDEDSRQSNMLYEKGQKLTKQGKHEEAIKFYTQALDIDNKNTKVYKKK